jgi:hypothetical protein
LNAVSKSYNDPNLDPFAQWVTGESSQSTEAKSQMTDQTRKVLEAYWTSHDPEYVAQDAVFTMMPTGEEIRGRDEIARHLAGFYHGSLTADAEVVNSFFSEGKGLLEALVVGKHTGDFAGIPATNRDVRVPLAVSYDVENGLIQRARIYLQLNVLIDQIRGSAQAAS